MTRQVGKKVKFRFLRCVKFSLAEPSHRFSQVRRQTLEPVWDEDRRVCSVACTGCRCPERETLLFVPFLAVFLFFLRRISLFVLFLVDDPKHLWGWAETTCSPFRIG